MTILQLTNGVTRRLSRQTTLSKRLTGVTLGRQSLTSKKMKNLLF